MSEPAADEGADFIDGATAILVPGTSKPLPDGGYVVAGGVGGDGLECGCVGGHESATSSALETVFGVH